MKRTFGLLIAFFLLTSIISCKNSNKTETENSKKTKVSKEVKHINSKKDCKDVHWGYIDDEHGPENWKNLCDDYSACGGKAQSPIDIKTNIVVTEKKLKLPIIDFHTTKVNIVNNGHTIQFNVDKGNKVNLNGKDYQLLQFHYHSLSEHTVDGNHFPIEVHFVTKHADNDYAVLGVFFKEGSKNSLFARYLDKFPVKKGNFSNDDSIDLSLLLPKDKGYYHYNGSLTTPPCSEVVNWYILKEPVSASKEQIDKFSKILHNNYRPVQQINKRKIYTNSK